MSEEQKLRTRVNESNPTRQSRDQTPSLSWERRSKWHINYCCMHPDQEMPATHERVHGAQNTSGSSHEQCKSKKDSSG